MFDRADAVLLVRLVLAGVLLTVVLLWAAGTFGAAWRVLMAAAGV